MAKIFYTDWQFIEVTHVGNSLLDNPLNDLVNGKTFAAQRDLYMFSPNSTGADIKNMVMSDLSASRLILKIRKL